MMEWDHAQLENYGGNLSPAGIQDSHAARAEVPENTTRLLPNSDLLRRRRGLANLVVDAQDPQTLQKDIPGLSGFLQEREALPIAQHRHEEEVALLCSHSLQDLGVEPVLAILH